MASSRHPWSSSPEIPQPSDPGALERSYAGFQAALSRLTLPQLLELAASQAALLEAQRQTVTTDLLSAWSRNQLDSPVLSSTATEFPSRPERDQPGRPSPFQPPSLPRRRSRSAEGGSGMAGRLAAAPSRRSR